MLSIGSYSPCQMEPRVTYLSTPTTFNKRAEKLRGSGPGPLKHSVAVSTIISWLSFLFLKSGIIY